MLPLSCTERYKPGPGRNIYVVLRQSGIRRTPENRRNPVWYGNCISPGEGVKNMQFPPKPLGYVKQGLAEIGHEISYVYDDLIFPDHTAYLIQFGEVSNELIIYTNTECSEDDSRSIRDELTAVFAGKIGFSLLYKGRFKMEQAPGEELKISFTS